MIGSFHPSVLRVQAVALVLAIALLAGWVVATAVASGTDGSTHSPITGEAEKWPRAAGKKW